MKKQAKSKLLNSLQSLGIVFVMLFALGFACGDGKENTGSTPQTSSVQSNISGTYWQLLSMTKKDVPVEDDANADVEFSKSGKWGIYRGGSAGQAGTYSVSGGNRLLMKYESGELYGSYTMTRKGDILELDDGEYLLRLRYSSAIDY